MTIIDVTLRIETRVFPVRDGETQKFDPVWNQANLIAIQQFILKQGMTQTYCNMYSNNPYYSAGHYAFYLDPDRAFLVPPNPSINSPPQKMDYHTLVVHDIDNVQPHLKIDFEEEYYIYIRVSWPSDNLKIGDICGNAEEAIKVFLEEIKRIEKS